MNFHGHTCTSEGSNLNVRISHLKRLFLCLKCIEHVEDSIIHQVSLIVHFRLENHHKIVSMLDDQYY